MKKNTRYLYSIIIILLTLMVNIGCFCSQKEEKEIVSSGELYLSRDEWKVTPQFNNTSDVITQYFVPQKSSLDSIMFRLAANDESVNNDTWMLKIELYDDKNNYICGTNVSTDDYNSWNAFTFKIEKKLSVGSIYKLVLQQISGPENEKWDTSIKCFLAVESIEESKGYSFNDEYQEGNLELSFRYSYVNFKPLWIIVIFDVLIMISIVISLKLAKNSHMLLRKVYNILLWISTPLVMFYLVQKIVCNTFEVTSYYICWNLLIYYLLLVLITLIVNKIKLTIIIYSSILMIFALIGHYVSLFRGREFMLFDIFAIKTAMAVMETYSFKISIELGMCLQAFIIFTIFITFIQNGKLKHTTKYIIVRCIGSVCTLCCLVISIQAIFEENKNTNEQALWNAETVYRQHGYFYELILQGRLLRGEEPENYSLDFIKTIANEIERENEVDEENESPQNIILIMNESLADLEVISEIDSANEILPYIRSMKENTKKGYLYVPIFGGGTSDSEYEVLTGNTKQFLPSGSNAYQMYCRAPEYGLVSTLEAMGYDSIALHPNYAINWNRENVYSIMGFNEFVSLDNWGYDYKNIRWCMSDQSTYEKVIKMYNEKDRDEKWFAFCVTMQNHGGYTTEMAYGYSTTVSLLYDVEYPQAEMYFSLINESDKAFQSLIEYFKEVDEKTMIIMFGDHQAAIEESFYEELFDKKLADLSLEELQLRYKVPYVIWTNYEQEYIEEDMSANFFGSYIIEQAGLELTTYNKFLLNLKKEIPIIGIGAICDSNGKWYSMDALPDKYKEILNQYKIIQYNNVFDYENILEDIFILSD